jgi:hypothetical protein
MRVPPSSEQPNSALRQTTLFGLLRIPLSGPPEISLPGPLLSGLPNTSSGRWIGLAARYLRRNANEQKQTKHTDTDTEHESVNVMILPFFIISPVLHVLSILSGQVPFVQWSLISLLLGSPCLEIHHG